jgi:hypothetical protein
MQLLGLAWAGESSDLLRDKAAALVAEQRADGSWAQLPGLASDAYATGQSLFALHQAAAIAPGHKAWRRGAQFLLTTQQPDGTWHVRRRSFPFQPTMDSGFPHGRDSWISAAGTSWALLALARATDVQSTTNRFAASRPQSLPAASEPAPSSAVLAQAFASRVDFDRDIRPSLERSCAGCHSGERPRSNYRVDTHAGLLAAGNLGQPVIVPGDAMASPILKYIADQQPDMEMPPLGKRAKYLPLTPEEIGRIHNWIDQGAQR